MKPVTLTLIISGLLLPAVGEGVFRLSDAEQGAEKWSEIARLYSAPSMQTDPTDSTQLSAPAFVFKFTPLSSNPADQAIFARKQRLNAGADPLRVRTLQIARSFLGVPYGDGGLNQRDTEQLIINLRRLNCWTFAEYSLALGLTGQAGNYETFARHVQELRYHGGHIDGYGSRNHYFSAWLMQAEKLGYVQDLTQVLGGVPYRKRIGYMTARPAKYPSARDADTYAVLRQSENQINAQDWYFIPKARVASMEHRLKEGDLILLTSAKKDLDIAHLGFAVRRNGRIHLLHASSLGGRVVMTAQPLARYLAGQRGQTGIMVARLTD